MAEARKRRKPVDVLVEVLTEQGVPVPRREDGVVDSVALLQRAEESVGIVAEAGEKYICRVSKVADELAVDMFEDGAAAAAASAPAPAPPLPAPAPAGHVMPPPRPDGASGVVAAISARVNTAHEHRVAALLQSEIGDRLIYGRLNPAHPLRPYEVSVNAAAKEALTASPNLVRWEGSTLRVGELQRAAKLAAQNEYGFVRPSGSRAAGAAGVARRQSSSEVESSSDTGGGGSSRGGGASSSRTTTHQRAARLAELPGLIDAAMRVAQDAADVSPRVCGDRVFFSARSVSSTGVLRPSSHHYLKIGSDAPPFLARGASTRIRTRRPRSVPHSQLPTRLTRLSCPLRAPAAARALSRTGAYAPLDVPVAGERSSPQARQVCRSARVQHETRSCSVEGKPIAARVR